MKSLLIKANIKLNDVDIEISTEDAIDKLIEAFGYSHKGQRTGKCFIKNGAIYRSEERGYGELSWDDVLVSRDKDKVRELESLLFLKQRTNFKNALEKQNNNKDSNYSANEMKGNDLEDENEWDLEI